MRPKPPRAIDAVLSPSLNVNASQPIRRKRFWNVILKHNVSLLILSVIVIVVGGGILTWYRLQQPKLSEVAQVEQAVGKLYILPKNEQPALATVTDKSKLATPFLQQANDGDKVLIYIKAKIVIIYRPNVNKIVAVGPVDISQPPSTNVSSP